ncbi:hypothetical protein DFA_12039 [Cavenderia fasciculata]|uniref:Carbohydrate binding domain-containing protein n=1 Tax=Cavenderia fasciculata TaxID=261658 RepID=F4QFG8_CACFS|nr:uncharacterized protein DFA_12039 [Cavenderia fasciculata]EGG14269.1 hypothetical protein DFA_12039 [Cavenderia fasciculata]|eukprot:XP_004350978.1 hypothetical protein DFA_12039 [Cavenderia fasciculata]
MTGFSDNRVFVLHFSLNQYSVLGQEKCGDVAKSPYTTPSSAPTQPPAAVSTSTTGSTPAPVSTTTTTTTTTTGPSTSTSAPKVAFSSTLKGSWSEGGIQYTQWDSSVINTGTTAISHLIITSTMTLKDSASLWRLDIVAPGQYTPSFVQTINPNESYDFSFIKSGSDAPSFNVQ